MVPEPSEVMDMLPLLVTLPPNVMLAPEVVGLSVPVVSIQTSPSVPAPDTARVPLTCTAPTVDGVPPYVTVLPAGITAMSAAPGTPLGSQVEAVFQLALLVAV